MINSNLINLESSKKDIPVIKHRGVLMSSTAVFGASAAVVNEQYVIMPIKFTSAIKSVGVFGSGASAGASNLTFGLISKDMISEILTLPALADSAVSYTEWKYLVLQNTDITLYQQMCTVETAEGKSRYVETAAFSPYKNDDFGYLFMKPSAAIANTRSYVVNVEYVEQLSQARNTDQF